MIEFNCIGKKPSNFLDVRKNSEQIFGLYYFFLMEKNFNIFVLLLYIVKKLKKFIQT